MWYSAQKVLSFNAPYSWTIGVRGGGKTHDKTRERINQWFKNKAQFMYIRRTEAELDMALPEYFNDMIAFNYFPGAEFKVVGPKLLVNGELAGWAYALSTAYKVRSVAFPNVKQIHLDEFLIEKRAGRYLPNEGRMLRSLVETVGRSRSDFRVHATANATSIHNPYFEEFGIYPRYGAHFTKFHNKAGVRTHVIELWADPEYVAMKKATLMAQAGGDDEYASYMYDNAFLNDNYEFIEPMKGAATYQCTLYYEGRQYGVWWQEAKGIYHVNKSVEKYCNTKFAFTTDDHQNNVILFKTAKRNPYIERLTFAFDNARVRFDAMHTKLAMQTLFGYLN